MTRVASAGLWIQASDAAVNAQNVYTELMLDPCGDIPSRAVPYRRHGRLRVQQIFAEV
jgi:hypothetical protein